ncbi:hypothetical protein [Aquimarina algiphila]|uniref:Uncharacterized protein n=1 Tax=Aquimarina algiphila TaxID=2047982 RepID=A0A554VG02_9FLAO|nr:hypothetical protein [Aquimarina algiphila]TSE06277.1 hypothetical protein FOF46_20030 [Aquimarina algiphila]
MEKYKLTILLICLSTFLFSQESIEVELIKKYKENFSIRTFSYSKNHYFARLSYNNQTIYLENLLNPQKRTLIFSRKNGGIKSMDFDSNEHFLATASYSGDVDIWDINNRNLLKTIKLHVDDVNKVKFVPNTSLLISVGHDGKIMLMDIKDEFCKPTLLGSHNDIIRSFDITLDGKYVVTIGNDNKVIVWNINKREKRKEIRIKANNLSSIKILDDKIVVGDIDGNILFLNLKDLSFINSIKIHDNIISSISKVSKNRILTSSYDGTLKIVEIDSNTSSSIKVKSKSYILHSTLLDSKITFSDRKGNLKIFKLLNYDTKK